MSKPLIFLAFADYRTTDDHLRELGAEQDGIVAALKEAKEAGLCEVVTLADATVNKIQAVFNDTEQPISIFHFAGHASGYELLLKEDNVQAEAFARFLGRQSGLQLVFLNGCSTQRQVKALQENGVPLVIATARSIEDDIACEFAIYFYQQLGLGKSISEAYQQYEYHHEIKGTELRKLYSSRTPKIAIDRFPWDLYVKQGSESAKDWNLPEVVGNPLFSLPSIPQNYDLPSQPFRYLHWFERRHAEVFFGRAYPIRELYERVKDPLGGPIILLFGKSGVGKSSLLHAGLFPRLENEMHLQYVRRQKDKGLLASLQWSLEIEGGNNLSWRKLWNSKYEEGKNLTVILDQVEESFTQPLKGSEIGEEWQDFLEVLQQLFANSSERPKGKLILSFRKEYLSEIEEMLEEKGLPYVKVFLQPLQKKDIIQAIVGITQNERTQKHYQLQIEEGLPEIMADDLLEDRDSAIAPVLQILLTKLWEAAIEENEAQPKFTIAAYQRLKKEGILLADFLQQQLLAIKKLQPKASESGLVLALLAYHTTPLGTAAKRTLVDLQEKYGGNGAVKLKEILTQLQNHYLLVATKNDEFSLAHDTLAPLVRERFDSSNKPAQQAARILKNKQLEQQYSRQTVYLSESELQIVEEGKVGLGKLDKAAERLLKESRAEIERLKRENVWIDRIAKTGVTLLVVALVAAVWFWYSNSESQKIAEANEFLEKAAAVADSDPTQSFHHAVEAWRLYPSGKALAYANKAMYGYAYQSFGTDKIFGTPFYRQLNLKGEFVQAANFSADGKWIVLGTSAGIAKVYNLEGRQFVWQDGKRIEVLEDYSKRGALVLSTKDESGKLELVNFERDSNRYRRFFPHHLEGKPIVKAAFSQDNSQLLMLAQDSTYVIWNLKESKGQMLKEVDTAIQGRFYNFEDPTSSPKVYALSSQNFRKMGKALREWPSNPKEPYVVGIIEGNGLLWNLQTVEIPKVTTSSDFYPIVDSLFFKTNKVQRFLGHQLLELKDETYRINFLGFRPHEITIVRDNDLTSVVHSFSNPNNQNFAGVCLVNDNRQMITMSADSTFRLWTIDPELLADSVARALYLKIE